jgi:hypothetical protein
VILQPCGHCRVSADCDLKREKLAQIRGSGLTVARFSCAKRRESLKPGMIVGVEVLCEDRTLADSTAVIIRWSQDWRKVVCWFPETVDGGSNWQPYSRKREASLSIAGVYAERAFWHGEMEPVCPDCGLPLSAQEWARKNTDAWWCVNASVERNSKGDSAWPCAYGRGIKTRADEIKADDAISIRKGGAQ